MCQSIRSFLSKRFNTMGMAVTRGGVKAVNLQIMPKHLHYYQTSDDTLQILMTFLEIPPDRVRYFCYGLTQGVTAGGSEPQTIIYRNGVAQATHTASMSTGGRFVVGATGKDEDWEIKFHVVVAGTLVYLNPLTAYITDA